LFIERLIAQGEPLREYGMTPRETLLQISDVANEKHGRFFENVIVIEVCYDRKFEAAALPLQTWGEFITQEGKKKKIITFRPDVERGLGTPFIIVTGGIKTYPQGRYGVPVYPAYPRNINDILSSRDEALSFLRGRLRRTLHLPKKFTSDEELRLAELLRETALQVKRRVEEGVSQGYALVVLALPTPNGPYRYTGKIPVIGDPSYTLVGESTLYKGRFIVGHLPTIVDYFWVSKMEEGAEKGRRERCSLCGVNEESVSVYSKAWSWLAPTWHAPLSEELKKGKNIDLAAAVGALCKKCYSSLIVGAGVFKEMSTELPITLTRELFVPVASAAGKEVARKSSKRPPGIWGCAMVIPLLDRSKDDGGEAFSEALKVLRQKQVRPNRGDRFLTSITGFEAVLPEDFSSDEYRLTMVYFSGQPDRGDIHLRAVIEDVLPSTINKLLEYMPEVTAEAIAVWRCLSAESGGDDRVPGYYDSLFYLLTRAYGGCYLWSTLRSVLHKRPISWEAFVSSAAARMNGWARMHSNKENEKQAFWNLKDEVTFYLAFRHFYNLYNRLLGGGGRVLSDWREMLKKISSVPPVELSFNDVEELGFAAGYLVRLFSRWYWVATGAEKGGKDFIKHRMMAFGSALTPDMIWKKGLSRFQEYALKLNKLDQLMSDDFRRRAGVVESEYRRLRAQVASRKDEFIGAFWSGYMLALEGKQEKL